MLKCVLRILGSEDVDFSYVAYFRVHLLALVNMVMNFRVT
jgi:hypothetical protein